MSKEETVETYNQDTDNVVSLCTEKDRLVKRMSDFNIFNTGIGRARNQTLEKGGSLLFPDAFYTKKDSFL